MKISRNGRESVVQNMNYFRKGLRAGFLTLVSLIFMGVGWLAPNQAEAAVPTVRAVGVVASGTGTITPGMPAGVLQNDILLLFIETNDQAITVSGGTETWTAVTGSPVTGATATRLTVFWARASQNTPTSPTMSDSGDHQLGRIIAVQGCITTGNPWDVVGTSTENTTDNSASFPAVTTTVAETLVFLAMAGDLPDANGTTNFGSWTNAALASIVERVDNTVTSGTGGALGVATGQKATVGATGATTAILTANAVKAMMTIALKPQPDTTPPAVSSILRINSSPTNATSVQYTVTFSESVTGVDITDFTLTTSGVTGASVTGVSGSGATYTVTVGTGSGDGTIRLDLTDNDTIVDLAGNMLGGTGVGNGNYTSGQVYAIDKTALTVSSVAVQTGLTVNVTFSEAMGAGVTTAANYTVSGTGTGTLASNPNSVALVSGNTYRLTWSSGDMLNGGNITITVANAQDLAGNTVGSTNSGTDAGGAVGVAPTITSTTPANNSFRNNANVGYTLSEAVVSGTITFTQTGGTTDPLSPQVYTMVAGDMTLGSHSVNTGKTLVSGAIYTVSFNVTDAAGNPAVQVANTNVLFDITAASVSLSSPAAGSRTNSVKVDYSLDKTIASGQITFTWTGGTADGASHTYNLNGTDLTSGSHTAIDTGFTLVDGAIYTASVVNVLDLAGNPSSPVDNTSVTFDSTVVAITATAPAASSAIKAAVVSYTLSEMAASGSVTFTQTGGTADPASPQNFVLTGGNLSSGVHTDVATGLTLVDGAVYTVSFNATDLAANPATTVSNALVTVDITAPTLNPVHIASNNADVTKAVTGDIVTVSFSSSESIITPTVIIAGGTAAVSGGPTNWSATRTVLAGDAIGAVTFSISVFSDLAGNAGSTVSTVTDASSVTNVTAPANVTLTITTAGLGSGTVYSSPGTIACASGNLANCSDTTFAVPTDVTLTAAPDWKSEVVWSVGCIGTGLSCGPFTLNGNTAVTATFNFKPQVMLPGPTYYATIQDAYNAVTGTTVLMVRDQTFSEDLIFNLAMDVTFDGGYDATWAQNGSTNINGTVTIEAGSVTVNYLNIT